MRVLLIGAHGQVGHHLTHQLAQAAEWQTTALSRSQLDLTDATAIRAAIRSYAPDVVINAAAYTAVDRAESEPELCYRVNAEAPAVMAEACKDQDALLVHYSTDYVFDGEKATAYLESDPTVPVNAYGRSKLKGEQAIAASGVRALVLRVSWVYSERGSNFFLTMMRKARQGAAVRVVNDQHGAPTPAWFIAEITHRLLKKSQVPFGTFHLAPAGATSWYGYTQEIFRVAGCQSSITPIATSEYPTPARRPKNSVLATGKLQSLLGGPLPSWQQCFSRFVDSIDLGSLPG
jgi:dTDP-4-dehydrorhamnose reductase